MTEQLDRAYASIMSTIVEGGQIPHFTELANDLDVDIETSRLLMHELATVTPSWMHPGTDYLGSFPPFNAQPTQYRISVDGKQKWYGQ